MFLFIYLERSDVIGNRGQSNSTGNTNQENVDGDFKHVHPIRPMTFVESDTRKHILRANLLKAKSASLKRAFSDSPDSPQYQQSVMTHRRTQSDAPTIQLTNDDLDGVVLRRTGSALRRNMSDRTKTREYYGAESYTTNDLVERRYTTLRVKQYVSLIE